jgi:hypothetical protein
MSANLMQQFDQAKLTSTSTLSRMQTTEKIANYQVSGTAEKLEGSLF